MAKNIFDYEKKKVIPKIKIEDGGDKHMAMMQAISPYAKPQISKNLTPVEIVPATKKTKVLLLLMPEWNTYFPPFNIARLSALSKQAGYETRTIDVNVKAHNYFHAHKKDSLDYDPWDPGRFFQWQDYYFEQLHDIFKDFFKSFLEEIKEYKPDLVGFSVYYCNYHPSRWFAEEIKKVLPNVKLAIGGPYMQTSSKKVEEENFFDFGVVGEGELLYLRILAQVELGKNYTTTQVYSQPSEQRINLNNMPIPNYDDFDFNDYRFPNGVLSEFSRGCVAKCTFCDETHFWKYRQRQAVDAIDEIEKLYYTKGTDVIWFIDSLVNGNLNELRAFAKAIIAKQLDVHWTGYARCDGRMDLEYYKDLAASGCTVLNYGCESASDRVLADMDKRVTVAEMEQNFRDGHKVGVSAMTNWIIGFPTETAKDFSDTLTFIYRNRNKSVVTYSNAAGFNLGPISIMGQNFQKFGVANLAYCNHWITSDYSVGKPHILVRSKIFSIWLQQINLPFNVGYVNRFDLPKYHYTIKYDDEESFYNIEYDNFEYEVLDTGLSSWGNKLVNEVFVMFRMLWKIRGGFHMTLKFDKELDLKEFGEANAGEFTAFYDFTISKEGKWKCKLSSDWDPPYLDEENNIWPWYYHDYSDYETNAAMRARKLARSEFGMGKRTLESKLEWQDLAHQFNHGAKDLRYNFEWEGEGEWTFDRQKEDKILI